MHACRSTIIAGVLWLPALAFADASEISAQSAEIGNIGKDTTFVFSLFHDGDRRDGAIVSYRTRDGSAIAGQDYQARSGRVNLAPGLLRNTVQVPLTGEPGPQADKQFTLELTKVISTGGPASFGAVQHFASTSGSQSTWPADLNGDGRPDLVSLSQTQAPGHVYVSRIGLQANATRVGASAAAFRAVQTIELTGRAMPGLTFADLNGDGLRDLISAESHGATGYVLLNQTGKGATTFSFGSPQAFYGSGPIWVALAAADFDGDGRPDLLEIDFAGKLTALLNRTEPGSSTISFPSHATFETGIYGGGEIHVADLDHDGKPDVVMIDGNRNIEVWRNLTQPGADVVALAPPQTISLTEGAGNLVITDFNRDGKPDIVFSNGLDHVTALLNWTKPGATTFAWGALQILSGNNAVNVVKGDFNGDGMIDVAVANAADHTVSVLYNLTTPGIPSVSFTQPRKFDVGDTGLVGLGTADLNRDGRLDLAGSDTAGAATLLNTLLIPTLSAPATATIHYPAPQ